MPLGGRWVFNPKPRPIPGAHAGSRPATAGEAPSLAPVPNPLLLSQWQRHAPDCCGSTRTWCLCL